MTARPGCYSQVTVSFNSGDHTTVTAFAGFWGVGQPATLQIDDIRVFSSWPPRHTPAHRGPYGPWGVRGARFPPARPCRYQVLVSAGWPLVHACE